MKGVKDVRDDDNKLVHLSEQDKRDIANLIVDEAADRIYGEIGKSVVKKLIWGVLIAAIVAAVWLGVVKIPHLH